MPMTIRTTKSKPEMKFQHGGRPFSETGSSFISAMEWDISSKFGMEIDFHRLKHMPSLNLNPEVHFWLYGRHLENPIWRHNSAADRSITTKFGSRVQNNMPMTTHSSKSEQEIQFQYGGYHTAKIVFISYILLKYVQCWLFVCFWLPWKLTWFP